MNEIIAVEIKKAFPGREGLAVNNDNKSPSPGRRTISVVVIILDELLHGVCMIIKKALLVAGRLFLICLVVYYCQS